MNIKMPNESEKDLSIDFILLKGLSHPKSLLNYLLKLYRSLGFGFIFWDTADIFLLSAAGAFGIALFWVMSSEQYIYGTLFAISPILFLLLTLITEAKERISGLYELKMTLKFTMNQIIAFQMLCFSGIGVAFCILMLSITWFMGKEQFFGHIVTISLCALFLCSFITLFTIVHIKGKWVFYIPSAIWVVICILPAQMFSDKWELFLSKIPIGVNLCMIFVLAWLYIREIKKLISMRKSEVIIYANC